MNAPLAPATARRLAPLAASPLVRTHPQLVEFTAHNGRTVAVVLTPTGTFDGALVSRDGQTLGHCSTIKSLARMTGEQS